MEEKKIEEAKRKELEAKKRQEEETKKKELEEKKKREKEEAKKKELEAKKQQEEEAKKKELEAKKIEAERIKKEEAKNKQASKSTGSNTKDNRDKDTKKPQQQNEDASGKKETLAKTEKPKRGMTVHDQIVESTKGKEKEAKVEAKDTPAQDVEPKSKVDKKETNVDQSRDVPSKTVETPKPKEDKKDASKTPEHRPKGDCVVCGELARTFCSSCKHVFYCKREHQKGHWKTHKEDCRALAKLPYRVNNSNINRKR